MIYDGVTMITFRSNLSSIDRSITWKGAREWNNLEPEQRNLKSLESFKVCQKSWLKLTIAPSAV